MVIYNEAVIYWIHLTSHTDIYTQGYVGVSKNLDGRVTHHIRSLTNDTHTNPHLKYAFKKYGWDKFVVDIFLCGEEEYCYMLENTLRSSKNIGWNISIGGHRGPGWQKGKKRDADTIKKAKNTRLIRYGDRKVLREQERKDQVSANKEARKQKKLQKQQDHAAAVAQRKLARSQNRLEKEEKIKQEKAILALNLQKEKEKKANISSHRPICNICKQRPKAIAYHKYGRIYYRSMCSQCIRKNKKLKVPKMRWELSGYKKKTVCDRCGFRSRWAAQMLVFHTDGNLNNNVVQNLKSICQNCVVDVAKSDLPWKQGDLETDH